MKVTVCFGRTGIVVPCKEGQLRVRELTQQALQRYLKTREKEHNTVFLVCWCLGVLSFISIGSHPFRGFSFPQTHTSSIELAIDLNIQQLLDFTTLMSHI
ncbi:hypothetical protein G4228_005696 [Cervus hanglu yarkandensis]|nr:hypothetical protein G4228_005696 [Cervus hanglu yarkandensis]